MRYLVTLVAFVVSLISTAVVVFFAVIFLAGPHGGALPTSLHTATVLLGWLCVIFIPLFVTRWVWRRQLRIQPISDRNG